MTSLVSEALAGFSSVLSPGGSKGKGDAIDKSTMHYQFVSAYLLPTTIKIQKELRGRKFREIQEKLQSALIAMNAFQAEVWPRRAVVDKPDWMAKGGPPASPVKTRTVPDATDSKQAVLNPDDENVSVSTSTTVDSSESNGSTNNGTSDCGQALIVSVMDDDPQTREFMHEAVTKALEAFAMVLMHPYKTTKSCEWALDCIMELVVKQYVSGRAGGKDDDSGSGSVNRNGTSTASVRSKVVPTTPAKTTKQDAEVKNDEPAPSSAAPTPPPSSPAVSQAPVAEPANPPSLLHQVVESITKCSDSSSDSIHTRILQTLTVLMTSPKCGIHESTMLMAIRSVFHVFLVSKLPKTQQAARATLVEISISVFNRMEEMEVLGRQTVAAMHPAPETPTKSENGDEKPFFGPSTIIISSQFHSDSYVLFRNLCKLAAKELPSGSSTSSTPAAFFSGAPPLDPLALKNKLLSLELVLEITKNAGDAFCSSDKLIYLVQTQLCVALLKNCMSNKTQVAFLSQQIFMILLYKFKTQLKTEIEIFLTNIFLRVLDSPNSAFSQKALVLESLRRLCNDPVILTQLFLHYDCDLEAMNLYKDIVFNLTKLSAKTTPTGNLTKKETEQHYELSLAGTEVLVTILKAFLRALGLPCGEDGSDDTAGTRIRQMLDINISALAEVAATVPEESESAENKEHDDGVNGGVLPANLGGGDKANGDAADANVDANGDASREPRTPRQADSNGSNFTETSSNVAGQIVDAFDRKRNLEQNFEMGSIKFTLSIKGGLNFLIDNGFVELNAESIGRFFLDNKDRLDKTQIGEVLGKEPEAAFIKKPGTDPEEGGPGFFVRILHHYVYAMDFTDQLFDDAIRQFLAGFRLPGEAQKIDRIMEKFAERFTRQNLEVFPSADTAFILAFSVIMLNTDLHNPSIKPERRMTLESFLRNNSGIGEGGADLPEDFLTGIFNRIKERPFSLKEDDVAREKVAADAALDGLFFDTSNFFGGSSEERKREKFEKERAEMMSATEQLIRGRSSRARLSAAANFASSKLTDTVNPADVVKPMFDITWGPMIGLLSQLLEVSNDERHISVCLHGFVYAIRVASHSNMSLARDTFVNSLAKFTYLGSPKEMKWKNIESIRTLLDLAVSDGEYLGESWGSVLQCISQLARIRMTASGLDSDESFLNADGVVPTSPRISADSSKRISSSRAESAADKVKETVENNGRAILAAVNEVLLDKVFSSTVNLSAQSLAHFIQQLVAVSRSEVAGDSKRGITGVATLVSPRKAPSSAHGDDGPSIFSLQRLVEVADYNMDVRPRLVWTQVWGIMADFFAEIGCHKNSMVSVFAIDSLKQLSFKFLDKPELSEFHFQRIFLKPFLQVMQNPGTREDIRELVLQCVDNIIRTRSHNLQSGWKIFFLILAAAAKDPSERITFRGLNILQSLLDEHLDELSKISKVEDEAEDSALQKRNRNSNAEEFIGMCRASLSYIQLSSNNSPRPIGSSMRALCHVGIFADLLADRRVLPPTSGAQYTDPDSLGYTYRGLGQDEELDMVLWRPIFDGLADGICFPASNNTSDAGCLVQRASVITFRAIMLRHGSRFSPNQLGAVLQQTFLPALAIAIGNDHSQVIDITSETPSITNLDFLADALPLPPPSDDPGLLKFEEVARKRKSGPKRRFGPAELLVEASFTMLRNGGDGDLSQVYKFAKKDIKPSSVQQPFPDSWIATTAPIALGTLSDILCVVALSHGVGARGVVWPCIRNEIQRWCNGRTKFTDQKSGSVWWPCEALVRLACKEATRISARIADAIPNLASNDAIGWSNSLCSFYEDTLLDSVKMEISIQQELIFLKTKEFGDTSKCPPSHAPEEKADEELFTEIIMYTPYGKGNLVEKRLDQHSSPNGNVYEINTNVIKMKFGMLYRPIPSSIKLRAAEVPELKRGETGASLPKTDGSWIGLVPHMKRRCVLAHCLQQSLLSLDEAVVRLLQEDVITGVLQALNNSRQVSDAALRNEDLTHAFQEAVLSEWGIGDGGMVEEALINVTRMSQTQGSAMFFLTQTSGATNAVIRFLRILYRNKNEEHHGIKWDREALAGPYLLSLMKDVMYKFVASEEKEGHLVDPNIWRNSKNASSGKAAVYCVSFAPVVVGLLQAMLSFESDQFQQHKQEFFKMICGLIRVQSEEIRVLVQKVLLEKFAPMLVAENGNAT